MSLRPCLDCGRLCAGSRCASCQRARELRRGSAAARGYDAAWQRLRAEHLAMEPFCRCGYGQPATDVDHILPRRAGGSDEHGNLQSLAHGHHSRKTALRDGGFGHLPANTLSRLAVDRGARMCVRVQVLPFRSGPADER